VNRSHLAGGFVQPYFSLPGERILPRAGAQYA
jgi:hypothetical protein